MCGEQIVFLQQKTLAVELILVKGCLSGEEEEDGGGGCLSGEENVGEEEGGGRRQIVVQSFSRRQEAAGAGHTVQLYVPVLLTGLQPLKKLSASICAMYIHLGSL